MPGFLIGAALATLGVFASLELLLGASRIDREQEQIRVLVDDLRLLVIAMTREIRDAGVDAEGNRSGAGGPFEWSAIPGAPVQLRIQRPASNCLGESDALSISVFSLVGQQLRCGNAGAPPIHQTLVDGVEFLRVTALDRDGQENWTHPARVEIELHFAPERTVGGRRIWTSQVALRNAAPGPPAHEVP